MIQTEQDRENRRNMAELKEKISFFFYNQFIDFERDKKITLGDSEVRPSFFLNKYEIIIDCFRFAAPGDKEYEERARLYEEAGVKYLFMDFRNLAEKNIEEFLRAKLPAMGVDVK
jgi:hypothetical protein